MEKLLRKHLAFWTDRRILMHLGISFGLFILSIFLTYLAAVSTKAYTGYVVPDILLDNLPVVNVGFIFFQGSFLFILMVVGVLAYEPKYIPFVLESTALFFLVRSLFMIMTHLTAPNVEYYHYIDHDHHAAQVIFTLSSGNDLFFSGHAGYPFLLALIFWNIRKLRFLFLSSSLIGSVAVILGHLHYSIDVFSAFFIAFGVFELSKRFFKEEHALAMTY